MVEEVEELGNQVISNIFLRPKKDGGHRLILDLTWVNLHVEYEHFKMHSLQTAKNMMRRDCWMGSIDLKDAYYSVPITEEHRRFLRFRWKGKLYQFRVMPNGLACAPRVFTKILNPVFAKLRERGFEGFPYIDDSFVVGDKWEDCQESLDMLVQQLRELGFVVHPEKSVCTPTKQLVFLGFQLDSERFRVYLTEDKEEKFIRAASDLLRRDQPTIREVAGLVGLMVAFAQAFSYAEAYVKHIEKDKIDALAAAKGDFNARMRLSRQSVQEVQWWLDCIRKSGRPVRRGNPEIVLYADASNEGWGAHVQARTAGGRWDETEAEDHINVLELQAVKLGLESLCTEIEDQHIRVMSDNTTAISYLNHHGGVKSGRCNQVAQEIWQWAEARQNWLSAAHIPGIENVIADYKSRNFEDNIEWSLSDRLFERIVDRFGEPDIDLFASRLNHKVDRFVSWSPEPGAFAIDAFSLVWTDFKFYAFPPFSLVGRTVEKILEDEARGVIVVPWWPSQPWWGRLVRLKLQSMRFRPSRRNLTPVGKPDNAQVLSKCPLGVFCF